MQRDAHARNRGGVARKTGEWRSWRWRRAQPAERGAWLVRMGNAAWILVLCLTLQCTRPVQVGQKAPDFVLESMTGDSLSLEDLRGKVVFLHFWATWCPPCLIELPVLTRFVETLDKGEYTLLAVCVDNENPARIREFLGGWGADVPTFLDPGGRLARKYGTLRFPETYVLDRKGVVCNKVIGPGDWQISKWAQILHKCAAKTDQEAKGPDAGA